MASHGDNITPFVSLFGSAMVAKYLHVAVKLGVPDRLHQAGPQTAAQLATALNVAQLHLSRVLRLLAQRGLLTEHADGRYENNAITDALRDDHPKSMAPMVRHYGDHLLSLFGPEMEDAVAQGDSAFVRHYGKPFFEWLAERPDKERNFSRYMSSVNVDASSAVTKAYDFAGLGAVAIADIGGSRGSLLQAILAIAPHASGVLFDLPGVIEVAGREEACYGPGGSLDGRVKLVAGSFFESVPHADVYVMRSILHDWSDEDCVRILKTIRKSIPTTGRVINVDLEVPPFGQLTPQTPLVIDAVMMATFGHARERTRQEFASIFQAAGFELKHVFSAPPRHSVFEAVPV
eukprot:TRINITY_DN2414_c0_g1_i2.p1 TRINITY_DN2414_c0_g1~~TRINITY_DN2414_c0_g1_i2.p1  ORF type:complete len:347 (-),score=111.62 TRINITY_DN2414_c0_g1_i2:199-1239(-)